MKKNYLLISVLSALVLSGCGNDNSSSVNTSSNTKPSSSLVNNSSFGSVTSSSNVTSSSDKGSTTISSSQAPAEYVPTVAESVAHISENYSVYYSLTSNGETYEFKNELERMSITGAEGCLAYFSQYSEYGYYLTAENEGYVIYLNGFGDPIYTTYGKLTDADVQMFTTLVDINSNFSNADWDYDGKTAEGVYEYYTSDPYVLASASFLTDYAEEDPISFVKASVKKSGKSYKISGFTTYDEDGNVVTDATIKRVGGSMPLDKAPVLNDNLDLAFCTKWMIASNNGNHLGGYMSSFEISEDGVLTVQVLDENTGAYIPSDARYEFVQPDGTGFYIFMDANGNLVKLRVSGGAVLFVTYDAATKTQGYDFSVEYYQAWFELAVNYLGYTMEPLTPDDVNYAPFVVEMGADSGFYLYEILVDETTGEEYIESLVLMVQYLNKEKAVRNYADGDTSLYNGYAFNGYAFGNICFGGATSTDAVKLLQNVASIIPTETCAFDFNKYPTVNPGETSLEYIVKTMESLGYTAVNKENADPNFEVNLEPAYDANGNAILDKDGNPVMEGVNFYNEINEIVEMFTNYTDKQGNVLFSATDYYFFYKANPNEDPEYAGDEYLYSSIMVCDVNMEDFKGGYGNVFLLGNGFFAVTGVFFEVATTWSAAQPIA